MGRSKGVWWKFGRNSVSGAVKGDQLQTILGCYFGGSNSAEGLLVGLHRPAFGGGSCGFGKAESLEELLTGQDGPQIYLSTKCPLTDENGTVIGLFGISMNITQRKNDEKIRQILVNELDHRLKNTLAVVHAMARQTFRGESIDKGIWAVFEGRIKSMSSAHGLLSRQTWVGADIADVVSEGLTAHDLNRIVTSGPPA